MLKGILLENPVFVLVLGTCPTLATTTSVIGAFSMGIAAMVVLICSNAVISMLRKVIPETVRIPCYIVIISGFVTIVKLFIQAYLPDVFSLLGVYLDLITVNCIILGRAEMFAGKNSVGKSVLDGVGMGIGFTVALLSSRLSVKFWVPVPLREWKYPSLLTTESSSLPRLREDLWYTAL